MKCSDCTKEACKKQVEKSKGTVLFCSAYNAKKPGRPKVPEENKRRTRTVSLTNTQYQKLVALGRSKWLQYVLDVEIKKGNQ